MITNQKNIFFTILLLFSSSVFAQVKDSFYNYKASYELKYQPDSTNLNSRKVEYMNLFISNNYSLFLSQQKVLMDSANISEWNKGNTFGPPMSFFVAHGTKMVEHIFKSEHSIDTYGTINNLSDYYKYKEDKSLFDWKITPDTMTIAGYHCQKAVTIFGNRKWEAWFTPEIPFSDGPYKFCGLPGLILQVHDSQNYWVFSFMSFVKMSNKIQLFYRTKSSVIPLKSKEDFFKRKLSYYKNPLALEDAQGAVFLSGRDVFQKNAMEKGRKDNNWIELYSPMNHK